MEWRRIGIWEILKWLSGTAEEEEEEDNDCSGWKGIKREEEGRKGGVHYLSLPTESVCTVLKKNRVAKREHHSQKKIYTVYRCVSIFI